MTRLRGLLRNRIVWAAALVLSSYWILAAIIPNDEFLAFLRALVLLASIAVAIAYAVPVLISLSSGHYDRVVHLTLGITLGWFAAMLGSIWTLLWRFSGQPAWMMNNDLVGSWIWLQFFSAVLHLTAPRSLDGRVPERSWIVVGFTVAAAILLTVYMTVTKPDLHFLIDVLEPYVPN